MVTGMPRVEFNKRLVLILLTAVVILIVGIPQAERLASDRDLLKPYDYVQYWTAGRQLLDGRNPYDPDELIEMQRSMFAGHLKTVMMWNPPWTLPIALPFAALPWRLAQFLWLGLQLVAVLVSADLLWRIYGGKADDRWVSWVIALTFGPTLFLLLLGQISGLLLLGIAGFLYFVRNERPISAGCCVALTAIKPHLLALLGLFIILEAFRGKSTRRTILAGALVIVVGGVLPVFWNHDVWSQYFEAMRRPPSDHFETMQEFEHPTIGYELRLLITGEPFAAQFIPFGIAMTAAPLVWFVRRREWRWREAMPMIVLVSVLTAAYGAWAFDLVVLLLPVLQVGVWLIQSANRLLIASATAGYLILNGLVLRTIMHVGSQANAWIAPVVFGIYVAAWGAHRLAKQGSRKSN